jgi:hypothetical protein
MRKLKLRIEALEVESFEAHAGGANRGTVRGNLSAYYELCNADDTWQQSCTCEPTCNADTCYNCSAACGSAQCGSGQCSANTCTAPACCQFQSIALTNCDLCP